MRAGVGTPATLPLLPLQSAVRGAFNESRGRNPGNTVSHVTSTLMSFCVQ